MTLSNSGIIGKANEAVEKTNIRQIESLATMLWAEAYANKAQDLKSAVEDGLVKNGITADKYAGYRLEVSANGVGFVKLNGGVTPPPTASDDQPGNNGGTTGNNIIPAGGIYYTNVYNMASGEYTCLEPGDEFPATVQYGDVYDYGDYRYTYGHNNGWEAGVNYNVVDMYSSTTFGEILESINGKAVIRLSFQNCSALTTVPEIPASVTHMYFAYCTALTTIPEIPNSITSMEYTFQGCTALTTVPEIPNSVTNMHGTFYGCTSLTTAPAIPSSVSSLQYTFQNCTALTTAPAIPNSVGDMYMTFSGCTSLTTAPELPGSVYNLQYTFQGCTALTTAPEIPSSVSNLQYTFDNCTSLTTVPAIPTSITSMECTFQNCTSLNSLEYAGTTQEWEAIERKDCFNGSPITTVTCSNGNACPNHIGGTANCEQQAVCELCGNAYGQLGGHIESNGSCTVCGVAITVIESTHNPYNSDLYYSVLGTWDYSDATSVDIKIIYETENKWSDWASITEGLDYTSGVSQSETRNYLMTDGSIANNSRR